MLYKCVDWFMMGLCFGMGFMVAVAVLRFLIGILSGAQQPHVGL